MPPAAKRDPASTPTVKAAIVRPLEDLMAMGYTSPEKPAFAAFTGEGSLGRASCNRLSGRLRLSAAQIAADVEAGQYAGSR
ncbi:hypothetical protein Misp03_62030 [Microbispora sp. NBRC 16548]|nr:hypothetical protein Misp03_62030 [Microbispora sp. NBRC 16548]